MSQAPMPTDDSGLLASRMRLPQHVVHRSFVSETVVLNLETGKYHGLNPVAGRMLDVLAEADDVRAAATVIALEYGQERAKVEADFLVFCRDLLARQLVEVAPPASP